MRTSEDRPPAELTAGTHTDLDALSRDWWDSLVHPSVYLRYDWLRGRSGTIDGSPRFVSVAGPDGEAVLAMPAYLTDADSHPGYDPAHVLAMEDLTEEDVRAEPGGATALTTVRTGLAGLGRALVVGAPGRMGGVSYADGLSATGRRSALAVGAAEVEAQAARAEAPTVCWLYFVEGVDEVADEVLLERGYQRVVVAADCYLPIRWSGFEDYLDSFRAKRRWKVRHELTTAAEAGVGIDLHGAEVLGPELAALELQWRQKYGRRTTLPKIVRSYHELREHIGEALRVFVARQDGRPIGFITFLEGGGVWHCRFPGFDYSVEQQLYLYFNLLFYHPVRAAIDRGITGISYSVNSYEAKCGRGCTPRNLLAYVRLPGSADLGADLAVVDRVQRRRFERIAGRQPKKTSASA